MAIPHLNISHDSYTVYRIAKELGQGHLKCYDYFADQKMFTSDILGQASRIVEAVILGMPLPSVGAEMAKDGVLTFVDHNFTLNCLVSFLQGKFNLIRLNVLKDFEGKYYKDILPIYQNRIDDAKISVYWYPFNGDDTLKQVFGYSLCGNF
jgi:hypothetical protein